MLITASRTMSNQAVPQFSQTTEQMLAAVKGHKASKSPDRTFPIHSTQPESSTPLQLTPSSQVPQLPYRNEFISHLSASILPQGPVAMTNLIARRNNAWRWQADVGIRVDGFPNGVTTLEVYRCFKQEGNISRIQVPNPRSPSSVYVNFCPPPHRAFWAGEGPPLIYTNTTIPGNLRTRLRCTITQERRFQVPSPVDPLVEYDELTRLNLNELDFGFMRSKREFTSMRTISAQPGCQIRLTLDLRFQKLRVDFALPERLVEQQGVHHQVPNRAAKYRLEVLIRHLGCIKTIESNTGEHRLLFTTASPPECYRRTDKIDATHDLTSNEWKEWFAWYRQTDIPSYSCELQTKAIDLRNQHAFIDLGRWTTFQLRLGSKIDEDDKLDTFKQILEDFNVPFTSAGDIQCYYTSGAEASIWKVIDPPQHDDGPSLGWLDFELIALPFAIRYQLEVCFSQGIMNEHNVTPDFLKRLVDLGEQRATSLLESAALINAKVNGPFDDPNGIFKLRPSKPSRKRNDLHFTYVRAAQITPTAIYYSTPVLETSNRVIRQYFAYQDRFLRVRFSDEEGKLRSRERDTDEEVFSRIRRALYDGISVGGRHYEFLAFGNSQLRDNGAWFFSSTNDLQAWEIRAWMGDLRGIKTVAKWASRLGQSFSTTRSVHSARVIVRTDADIIRNGYNFTDGVGKISPFLSQLIAMEFGAVTTLEVYPSLYQFRMGGCKGVLAIDPTLTRSQEVIIRESQYKFPAASQGLDVIRYSSFAASMLNRQIIIVLDSLGVSSSVFLGKQSAELAGLEKAMHDPNTALTLLQKRIDFNQMTLSVSSMIQDGFMDSKEPFFMSILHLWRAWNVKYLKEKARITVDQGAFLLGCVDETGHLRGHQNSDQQWREVFGPDSSQWQPEIFVQVRDPPHTGAYKVRQGLCLVTRNPALHSGDIRVVRAVDVPSLHHLKDVVVFPQTGKRDIASMCSGGDLDGDDYLVFWDTELLPPQQHWNQNPMDFSPPPGPTIDRDVVVDDIKEFFVKYIKYNRLELIAHSHLGHADRSQYNIEDPKCRELAALHSVAVDYAKTGVPAQLSRNLIPTQWPHFMEKNPKKTYKSQGILGQLYDQVQLIDFEPLFQTQFDQRILDAYDWANEQMSAILPRVKSIKQEYDNSVRRIMAKHSIASEFEVWSTFVLSHNRSSGDYKFHEEIGSLAHSLKTQYRDEIIEEAGGRNFEELEPWIAAMYKVSADEMVKALGDCNPPRSYEGQEWSRRQMVDMPFMSFPWIFQSELGRIAIKNRQVPLAAGFDEAPTKKAAVKKARHRPVDSASHVEPVMPDLDAPGGVVGPGEELMLFHDAPSSPLDRKVSIESFKTAVDGETQGNGAEVDDVNNPSGVANASSALDRLARMMV